MAEQAIELNGGLPEFLRALRQRTGEVLAKPYLVPLVIGGIPLILVVLLSLFVFYTTFVPRLPTKPEWTLANWALLADPHLWTVVMPNTLIVGFGAVAVTLFFAGPMAWLLVRTTIPFKNTLLTCVALVMVIPPFVKSMGWVLLLNERIGILNRLIVSIFPIDSFPVSTNNVWGIAWVMGLTLMPTTFFLIAGPMRQMDPAMEEAASICGASKLKTFLYVGMPLVWPAVVAAGIFTFMTAISLFEVPAIIVGLGGSTPVLATEMFFAVYGGDSGTTIRYGAAGVYAMLMMVPCLIGLYFYFKVIGKAHRYRVVTGKGYRPRDIDIGWWKWPGLIFIGLFLLFAAVLPLLWLVWISVASFRLPSIDALQHLNFGFYSWNYILTAFGGWPTIRNTIVLVVAVCIVAIFLSVMISWVVVRTKLRIRRVMDAASILPHAIPGLAFAFALFILALTTEVWTGLSIVGTMALLVVANVLSHLSYTTRVTNAALIQVHNELEEASRTCGATPLKSIFFILIPLIRPALVFVTIWVALRTFRELTMALFLTGTDNKVMAVQVWLAWNEGGLAQAAAGAVVMTIGCAILLFLGFVVTKGGVLKRATGN
ncbi:MAG TPA: iron ABC transporter permease [Alphaproteobacteria bacterium]